MKFKKIYIEITNSCNLSCNFCPCVSNGDFMMLDNFELILQKIDNYTDYIYLHILGEPLLHPLICDFIDLGLKYNKFINITTNGTLLKKKMKYLKGVRQINVSLSSLVDISILDDIVSSCDVLARDMFISYRLWVKNKFEDEIISKLNLGENLFLSRGEEFIWPNLENNVLKTSGSCYGTIDHIGILVDGTVIPCCLDYKGIINLGNIYTEDFDGILNSDRFLSMREGFKKGILVEELCSKCGFRS